ncbi:MULTISPECIES: IclR family transcriptional regulator [Nocardioides]|uniref:IclR family transcriptional regulator n=1 Tax=Nocardioides TaxID=1839 RepID=UPI0004087FB1|nr:MULTISPECIES: helix-turn-helix domain-containing protein [Nocardioides]
MSDVRGEPTEVRGTLGTVRNAVRLLDLLADGSAYQQLTDLAERSGLSVPTAHRLLRSLVLADLVEQDPRSSRYSLGPEVTRLSQRYLGRLPILGALSPYLVSLRDTLQTTIHVAVLVRESVVYVDRIDASDGGPYRDSHRVTDALSTAAGRMLAARAGDEVWKQCVASHAGLVDEDPDRLRAEWSRAAHLTSGDEIAVVVHDAGETPVAALSATVPPGADAARVEVIATHLSRAASAAGRTLGHG